MSAAAGRLGIQPDDTGTAEAVEMTYMDAIPGTIWDVTAAPAQQQAGAELAPAAAGNWRNSLTFALEAIKLDTRNVKVSWCRAASCTAQSPQWPPVPHHLLTAASRACSPPSHQPRCCLALYLAPSAHELHHTADTATCCLQSHFRGARAALKLKRYERAASLAHEGLQQHPGTAELEQVLKVRCRGAWRDMWCAAGLCHVTGELQRQLWRLWCVPATVASTLGAVAKLAVPHQV